MANAPRAPSASNPVKFGILTVWHYISYFVPVMMVLVGYMYEPLRTSIHDPLTDAIWKGLFWIAGAGFLWIIIDLLTVYNHLNTASRLRENTLFSIIFAVALAACAGYMERGDQMGWYLFIPAVAASLDAIATAMMSIENALGKPNIQVERQT